METFESTAVGILSGGLDSTTMVYDAINRGARFTSLVSFNYGQRHKKELRFATATAEKLELPHHVIDLGRAGVAKAIASSGSSLVSDTPVPEGHYAEENMKATVVPNRNMMMISVALAIAVAEGAQYVATGVHAGDHFVYPDCRPEFIEAVGNAGYIGNVGFGNLSSYCVVAPYLYLSKAQIARRAIALGVPLEETWSCYKGGKKHCGKCGTCVERLEAIDDAIEAIRRDVTDFEFTDPTEYEDDNYWKEVIANAS